MDFIDYKTHVCVQMTIKFTQLFKHICQGQLQHLSPARPAEAAKRHVWRCARITVGVVRRGFFPQTLFMNPKPVGMFLVSQRDQKTSSFVII